MRAEALLGLLLQRPADLPRMGPLLTSEDFGDPVLGSVYSLVLNHHKTSRRSPITDDEVRAALTCSDTYADALLERLRPHRVGAPADLRERAESFRRHEHGRRFIAALAEAREASSASLASGESLEAAHEAAYRLLAIQGGVAAAVPAAEVWEANKALEAELALEERTGGETGFTWGLPSLDRTLGGLRPGELTVLGARMKVGKTHLAIHLANRVASRAWAHLADEAGAVLFCTFEMEPKDCQRRAIAWHSCIPAHELRNGTEGVTKAIKLTDALDMRYISTRGLTIEQLSNAARSHALRRGIDLLVVDYLDLIRRPSSNRDDLEIGRVVRGLIELAAELEMHVLLLAQLNRDGDGEPSLRHLAGSDEIARAAHTILLLHERPRSSTQGLGTWGGGSEVEMRLGITARRRRDCSNHADFMLDRATSKASECVMQSEEIHV